MRKQGPKSGAIWALGAMSGTSLDGFDAAMILTDGHEVMEFGPHAYRPYSRPEQEVIRTALGRWPDEPGVAEAAGVRAAGSSAAPVWRLSLRKAPG